MVELEQVGRITEKDLIDQMVRESGHVAPPTNSFTVNDYMEAAKAQGCMLTHNTALDAILRKVEAGEIEGAKMNVGGRQRWVFWQANHREAGSG